MIAHLAFVLTLIMIIFLVICLVVIGVSYAKTRKRSNNYFDKQDLELRYFIQKQVDYNQQVIGYECLLRQHNQDDTWSLPKAMDEMPLQRVIFLLEETFKSLPEEKITLSINLSYEQIMSPEFNYFVRWAISKIEPMQLAVELHIDRKRARVREYQFKRKIETAKAYGMQFAIDNVGSKLSNLKNIEPLLSEVDILKCSMRSFRKDDPAVWLDLNLQFWNKLAKDHNIQLVLMGVEDEQDEALAEQLKINWRQGYLFGKPMGTGKL